MIQPTITVDLTNDELVLFEDHDEAGIYTAGDGQFHYLILGHLKIKMTIEQEEKLRKYYQET